MMNLGEFVKRLEGYDLSRDREHIAADLKSLAQNRSLLGESMLAHIHAHGFSRGDQAYNAYSFSLYNAACFSLRMTLWMPVESDAERQSFIYGLPHTHDFELYAVGYHGGGYRTVKFPLLNTASLCTDGKASVGQPVSVQLSQGTLLHMRAFEEMHYQIPPAAFSISLALMIATPAEERRGRKDWCFDDHLQPIYSGLGSQEEQVYQRIEALWHEHQ